MDMTADRWNYTNEYSREVFGQQDEHLAGLMTEATAAGLPDIAVSADVGRLLMMLTTLTRAKLALEVGTLGGYSGIWIARGLAEDGRLITIEREPNHAAFAERQFERAGVADRVEVRMGDALEILPRLAGELGPGSVDLVFIDAEKTEYPDYWEIIRPLVAVGGVVLADNVLGTGAEWIDQQDQPQPRAVDRFNRLVAGDDDFEAVAVPLRQGVLFARRCAG
jgi:caffeoyl-CoA O-methyltransferase